MARRQPEGRFVRERMLKDLRSLPRAWFERVQQQSLRGTPDVLGCLNSRFVALEAKRGPGEKPTELQLYKLRLIEQAGGFAAVPNPENWDDIFAELQEIARG